jgi:hypothetical protein
MTVIALLPLLVAMTGVLTYALASNTKIADIGRIAFACGLLAFLLISGPSLGVVHVR